MTINNFGVFKFFDGWIREIIRGKWYKSNDEMNKINVIYGAISLGLSSTVPILIVLLGCLLVNHEMADVGTIFLFYSYFTYIIEPMHNLNDAIVSMKKALVLAKRTFDFNNSLLKNQTKKDEWNGIINSITFKNVSIAYDGNTILHGVNVEFTNKQCNIIVGKNGIGKSSLMKSIVDDSLRSDGNVLINEVDAKDFDLNCIHYVSQADSVFSPSIKDNV